MFNNYPDVLNVQEMQEALGVGRSMAYRLIHNGKIRHLRIGTNIKIPRPYLIEYVQGASYGGTVAKDVPYQDQEMQF